MKKKILIVSIIIVLIAIVIGTMYLIDRNRMKNNEPVIFSTWGYSYAPPATEKTQQTEQNRNYVVDISISGVEN